MDTRAKLLQRQAKELESLLTKAQRAGHFFSDTVLGYELGVCAMTIWNWRRGRTLAKKMAMDRIRKLCT